MCMYCSEVDLGHVYVLLRVRLGCVYLVDYHRQRISCNQCQNLEPGDMLNVPCGLDIPNAPAAMYVCPTCVDPNVNAAMYGRGPREYNNECECVMSTTMCV